jgi:hypothetical protein
MLWAIYTIVESILPIVWLKWGHVLVTLIALIIISYSSAQLSIHDPHKYYTAGQLPEMVNINTLITKAIALLLISQLLFIANIATGIVKKALPSIRKP